MIFRRYCFELNYEQARKARNCMSTAVPDWMLVGLTARTKCKLFAAHALNSLQLAKMNSSIALKSQGGMTTWRAWSEWSSREASASSTAAGASTSNFILASRAWDDSLAPSSSPVYSPSNVVVLLAGPILRLGACIPLAKSHLNMSSQTRSSQQELSNARRPPDIAITSALCYHITIGSAQNLASGSADIIIASGCLKA